MSHLNASLLSVKHDHDQSKLDLSHAKGNLINHDDDDFHHPDLTVQVPSSLKRRDFMHVNNDAKHDLDQVQNTIFFGLLIQRDLVEL